MACNRQRKVVGVALATLDALQAKVAPSSVANATPILVDIRQPALKRRSTVTWPLTRP